MKYPNPTFLKTARDVKNKRRTRILILCVIVSVIILFMTFVLTIAKKGREYAKLYPELVGAATAERTERSSLAALRPDYFEQTTTTEETTTTTEETTTTTELMASVVETTTEDPNATTTEEVVSNEPEQFTPYAEDFHFSNSTALQTVSHTRRDQLRDDLRYNVFNYANELEGTRLSFYYINLENNEFIGINELEPIVPAGAFALPVSIAFYQMCEDTTAYLYDVVTYDGTNGYNSSVIEAEYNPGKQFYLRTLSYYMLAHTDTAAFNMLLNRIGGIDRVLPRINEISSYIAFDATTSYTNYLGQDMLGSNRSSVYDMALYAEYLYYAYLNDPEIYQDIINDLAYSEAPSAVANAFGESRPTLSISGQNDNFGAYTELSIVDAEEPIVVCIYCECDSRSTASVIMADIATYVSRYIASCYE